MKITVRTTVDGNVDERTYDEPRGITYRERRLIKELTGLSGLEWIEACARFDDDVALGLAAVCLHRAGRFPGVDAMLDRAVDSITLDFTDELAQLEREQEEGRPPDGPASAGDQPPASSSSSASSTTPPESGTRS